MSIFQLIFKKGNFIGEIELDAIITEGALATAKLTENPVENGANMNDHIIIEPMSFTMEGVVSNISSSVIGQFTRVPAIFTPDNTKAHLAWNALLELQISKEPFTLVQGLRSYDNIVILSLKEDQNKDTANGLFFTATMKEVIFVGSQIIVPDQFNDDDTADSMVPATTGGQKQLVA